MATVCFGWSYGGVFETADGFKFYKPINVNNILLMFFRNPTRPPAAVYNHLYQTWTVGAQCCNKHGSRFLPCDAIDDIADQTSPDAEQAFSTACAYSGRTKLLLLIFLF